MRAQRIKHIHIEAGHNDIDPGASAHGYVEAEEAKKDKDYLIRALAFQLQHRTDIKIIPDVDSENLNQTISRFKKTAKKEDALISLHYNAVDNQNVRGVEVWVKENASRKEIDLGNQMCETYSKMLQIPNRGVKFEQNNRWKRLGILHTGAGFSILVEIDFISHPDAMKKVEEMRERSHIANATILINALDKNND